MEIKPTITYEDFTKIDLRAAYIEAAERVPGSEKLLKLTVSLGDDKRQIIAGIGLSYDPEALVGQTIVIIANLEPRKLMGFVSEGMLLAADGGTGPVFLSPITQTAAGAIIK